jgi:hypothetical protein
MAAILISDSQTLFRDRASDLGTAPLNTYDAIQRTNITTLEERISAANTGLFEDPYSQLLAPSEHVVPKQSPTVNRSKIIIFCLAKYPLTRPRNICGDQSNRPAHQIFSLPVLKCGNANNLIRSRLRLEILPTGRTRFKPQAKILRARSPRERSDKNKKNH